MNDDSLSHFPVAVLNMGEYLRAYCGWCEADLKAAETPEPASSPAVAEPKAEQIKFREFL